MKNKRLIVVVGPTAVGKTEFAIQLAEHFNTEIISADSRQVFTELTVGTAKPTVAQLARVKHHFVNTRPIQEEYDAGQFGRDALTTIEELLRKHDQVILCGGSGLYVKAVCEGFDDMPDVPPEVRNRVVDSYKRLGLAWLQKEVAQKDPAYFEAVDQKNPQRLMRALELVETSRQSISSLRQKKQKEHPFTIVKIGLELERDQLYERINSRMDQMIANGLFEEAKVFYPVRQLNALQTVGYQEIFGFMDGLYDRTEAIRLLKRNSRRYAKRQLTWFKKDKDITWFNAQALDQTLRNCIQFLGDR